MNSKVTGVLNSTLKITIGDLEPHLVSEDLAVVKFVMSILCLNLNDSRSLWEHTLNSAFSLFVQLSEAL